MRGFRVVESTIGRANPSQVTLSGGYRYRGDENWPEDRSAYQPDTPSDPLGGGPGSTGRRQQRIDGLAAALDELGYDPLAKFIPTPVLREAGGRVGVGVDTARDYRAEIRRSRRGGEVRDA